MLVYTKNKHGEALMPCTPRKARLLLREGKAKVIQRTPFTIQFLYGSSGYKQPVSLGIDAGTKHIGVSATTNKKVLYEAEVQLRTDIQELLATRRSFRRSRRHRKTRYRKARFLNRKKKECWLPPSIQHKVESHLKVIDNVHKLLPITKLTIEVAQFDIQKLKNPAIRIEHGLDKGHTIDARCISGHPLAEPRGTIYLQKQVRKNNRQLHKANPKKGARKSNKAERYVKGFQLFDKVCFEGQECFVFGRRKSGYFDIRLLDGTVIHRSASVKKLDLLERASTLLIERGEGQFLLT